MGQHQHPNTTVSGKALICTTNPQDLKMRKQFYATSKLKTLRMEHVALEVKEKNEHGERVEYVIQPIIWLDDIYSTLSMSSKYSFAAQILWI